MQKQKKTLWAAACLGTVVLAAVTTVALAQGGPAPNVNRGGPPDHAFRPGLAHPMMERMLGPKLGHLSCRLLLDPETAKSLNLTEEQQKKIRKIDELTEEKDIDQAAALKKARLQLRRLMEEDRPDRTKIMDQVDKVNALEAERQKLDIARRLDLRETLTAEQLTRAMELRGEVRKRMRDRFDDAKDMWGKGRGNKGERMGKAPGGRLFGSQKPASAKPAPPPPDEEPGESD